VGPPAACFAQATGLALRLHLRSLRLNNQRPMARLHVLSCSCLAVASIAMGAARAWAAEAELWGELRVPGGVEAARRVFSLGPQDHRVESEWLPDFTHRFGQFESWPSASQRLQTYLRYLDQVRQAALALPGGIRAPAPSDTASERDRARNFLELIGLKVSDTGGPARISLADSKPDLEHADWLAAAGVDVRAIATRLNAGEAVRISLGESILPLPLPTFWTTAVFKTGAMPIESLLSDRGWTFLYVGLLALDDETLGFLAAHPGLLQALHDDAPAFAAFAAESFRVRNGRVDLAGGPDTESIWRGLVGRPSTEPENFLRELVGRDGGRLAYFYAVVDQLERSRQTAVLGGHAASKARPDFVKECYAVFRGIDPTWTVSRHPFHRPSPDPALVILVLDMNAGEIGPGWLAPLLDRVVTIDDWSAKPADVVRAIKDRPADLRWGLSWVYGRAGESVARFKLLRFAQRRFLTLDRTHLPDLDAALRGAWLMPALTFALERMGITDVAVYAHAARGGHDLSSFDQVDRTVPRLVRWQSALALLEQVERRRHLPPDRLNVLVNAISDAATDTAHGATEAVAGWMTKHLLTELVPGPIDRLTEREAIHWLVHGPEESGAKVSWEGVSYIYDETGSVERDVAALRRASPAPDLGHLIVLDEMAGRLAAGMSSLEDLRSWLGEFAAERAIIERLQFDATQTRLLLAAFDKVSTPLGRIDNAKDLPRAKREAVNVGEIADALTDAIVPPLVYALAVSPLNRPAGVFADTWRQHSLSPLLNEPAKQWRQDVWMLATSVPREGGGTTIRGSYLGLDLVLAESRLPRPPGDLRLDDSQFRVLTEALVLTRQPASADVDAIVAALGRGRNLAQGWRTTPAARERIRAELSSAGVDPRRANAFLWTLTHDPNAAPRVLTTTELMRLGGGHVPDAWGTQMKSVDGCPCARALSPGPMDNWRGSWPEGVPAAMTLDLQLRLAEHLNHMRLPAFLVDAVRPAATSEWLARIVPFAPDDWQAFPGWPSDLPESRVEQYLLALKSKGILVESGTGGRE
jgi:hypothetical protein